MINALFAWRRKSKLQVYLYFFEARNHVFNVVTSLPLFRVNVLFIAENNSLLSDYNFALYLKLLSVRILIQLQRQPLSSNPRQFLPNSFITRINYNANHFRLKLTPTRSNFHVFFHGITFARRVIFA